MVFMNNYKVKIIIDYQGQDVIAVFLLCADSKDCAKVSALSMINDFYTRDGDAYVASIEEA